VITAASWLVQWKIPGGTLHGGVVAGPSDPRLFGKSPGALGMHSDGCIRF
jgi:hypothetical protein